MKFLVTVDMGNDIFKYCPGFELARILRGLAERVEHYSVKSGDEWPCVDENGKKVGRARLTGSGTHD